MSKTSTARHRKAARPLNSLVGASPMVRRSLAVAASSGLALTVVASGAAASGTSAQAANSAGTLKSASVTTVALDAREAVTTNAALDVSGDVQWSADSSAQAGVSVEKKAEPAPAATATPAADTNKDKDKAEAEEETTTATQNESESESSSSTTTQAETPAPAASASASSVAALAMQYVGVPYVWGGSSPSGFDCSGLVSYVYAQFGVSLPHQSEGIRAAGTVVSASEARPGDVVWWPGHVGIYMGNGMMVDAANESIGVQYASVYAGATYLRIS